MEEERERLRNLLLKYKWLPGGPTQRRLAEYIHCTEADISRGIDLNNGGVLSEEKVTYMLERLAPLQEIFDAIREEDWQRLRKPHPEDAAWMEASGRRLRKTLREQVEILLQTPAIQPEPEDALPSAALAPARSHRKTRLLAAALVLCFLFGYGYCSGWFCKGSPEVYRAYYWGIDTAIWQATFRFSPCGKDYFRVEAEGLLKSAREYPSSGRAVKKGKFLEMEITQKNLFNDNYDYTLQIKAHVLQRAGQPEWAYLQGQMLALSAHERAGITVRPVILVPEKHLQPDCIHQIIQQLESMRQDSLWWQFKRPDERLWLCAE